MTTMIYIKNDSKRAFKLYINKLGPVQINPGELKTFPNSQMLPNAKTEVAKHAPHLRMDYYDSAKISHEDLVEMIEMGVDSAEWNGSEVVNKTPRDLINDKQVITDAMIEDLDLDELIWMNAKLGNNTDGTRAELSDRLSDSMKHWTAIDVNERSILSDDEVELALGS